LVEEENAGITPLRIKLRLVAAARLLRKGRVAQSSNRRNYEQPQIDDKNPNAKLAKRPIVGLQLFLGMKPQGPRKWSGQI
jgi:Uncharacterized protein conserved in bacteria (DUF2147)